MSLLLRTNTSYEHLAKKFERAVVTCIGRDGCLSTKIFCLLALFSEREWPLRARLHVLSSRPRLGKIIIVTEKIVINQTILL